MKCPSCNADIKEGSLYCEKCGEEIHIVPVFEPEIEDTCRQTIESMTKGIFHARESLEAEKSSTDPSHQAVNYSGEYTGGSAGKPAGDNTKDLPLRNKRIPKPVIFSLIGLAFSLIIGTVVCLTVYFTSDGYKQKCADEAYAAHDYAKASMLYRELLEKDKYNIGLKEIYADCVRGEGNIDGYIAELLEIADSSYATQGQKLTAYEKVISIYDEQGDYDSARSIVEQAGLTDKHKEFYCNDPVISPEEAKYEFPQYLVIEGDEGAEIHYTVTCENGVQASVIADDEIYEGPILLQEGIFRISAYAVNERGITSGQVKAVVSIIPAPPDKPEVFPKPGEYFEPRKIKILDYKEGSGDRVYYTIDGSMPNSGSYEYTGEMVLLPGMHEYRFIRINEKGIVSDTVDGVYNLILECNYPAEEAHDIIMNRLFESGIIQSPEGYLPGGGRIDVILRDIKWYDPSYRYVFEEVYCLEDGSYQPIGTFLSLDFITGEVADAEY